MVKLLSAMAAAAAVVLGGCGGAASLPPATVRQLANQIVPSSGTTLEFVVTVGAPCTSTNLDPADIYSFIVNPLDQSYDLICAGDGSGWRVWTGQTTNGGKTIAGTDWTPVCVSLDSTLFTPQLANGTAINVRCQLATTFCVTNPGVSACIANIAATCAGGVLRVDQDCNSIGAPCGKWENILPNEWDLSVCGP